MAKKGGRPNKVKKSRYLKQINEMIIEGVSPDNISKWLKKQEPPENIGKTALYDYKNNDFNVDDAAVQEYAEKKSKEQFDEAVKKRVSEIETLDQIIKLANDVNLDINTLIPEYGPMGGAIISQVDIEKLKIQVLNLVVNAAKAKNSIVNKEEPQPINVNVTIDERRERLKRIEAKYDSSSGTDTRGDTEEVISNTSGETTDK